MNICGILKIRERMYTTKIYTLNTGTKYENDRSVGATIQCRYKMKIQVQKLFPKCRKYPKFVAQSNKKLYHRLSQSQLTLQIEQFA